MSGFDPAAFDMSPVPGGVFLFCQTCITELRSITGMIADLGEEPRLDYVTGLAKRHYDGVHS